MNLSDTKSNESAGGFLESEGGCQGFRKATLERSTLAMLVFILFWICFIFRTQNLLIWFQTVWFFWFSTYIKKILNYTGLVSSLSVSAPQAKIFDPFCAQGEIPYYFSIIWNDFLIFVSNISRNIYKDFSHPRNVYKDLYICI